MIAADSTGHRPATVVVAGAGNRGQAYAQYALELPDELRIVGIAEPREVPRARFARDHGLNPDQEWADWRDLADRDRKADGVIIALQDALHVESALAFAEKGYHILLEKPMAPTLAECEEVTRTCSYHGVMLAVCHTFRYTAVTQRIKHILDSGILGDLVSIQHFEPVGYWHQAHGYVRGSWRREAESGPMLLSKSCHDIDWLHYLVGAPCSAVSSFGSLSHFRPENRPADAADRCVDCSYEPECPYSALKLYLGNLERGETGWPVNVLAAEVTEDSIREALRTGPYGRCVYACDNDVVDNQVVNLLFENGVTANLTMNAFNKDGGRKTRFFGTRGELRINGGDGRLENGHWIMEGTEFRRYDFLTDRFYDESPQEAIETRLTGHDLGDFHLMRHFVAALLTGDESFILSGGQQTLESHQTVFAAEQARRELAVIAPGKIARQDNSFTM
jgi:predicted dehydrogenase